MPIVRWHGWGAKCRRCGQFIDLGDGLEAYKERDHVRDSLDVMAGDTIDALIESACGCAKPPQRRTP